MKKREQKLLDYAGKYRYLTYLACGLSGISALVALVPYLYIWKIVQEVFRVYPHMDQAEGIVGFGVLAVVFAVVSILIYFAALMCSHVAAFRTARNMRSMTLHHLVTLPLGFFKSEGSGKLRRIIDESAGQTEAYLAHQLPDMIGAYVTPVAVVVLMMFFDWRLGVISLIPLAIGVVFLKNMMGETMEKSMGNYQNALEDMNNQAVEYIRGIPVVKIFQQTVFSFEKFHHSILEYKQWAVNYTLSMRLPMSAYTLSINSVFALLVPAGILFFRGAVNPARYMQDFIFYILITPLLSLMLNRIMFSGEKTMLANDAKRRIESILEIEALAVEGEEEAGKIPKDNGIVFEQVSFTYEGAKEKALKGINLVIEPGQTIALVGPSGGGKSTLAQLIPRFWDPQEGTIRIGGIPVKEMETEVLMNQIAFVFQQNRLFKGTLLENVRMARPDASEKEVMEALKQAQCMDIIEKMPQGLNTYVGGKGVYLSGGEVQRITLARAILKDAPIIVLDEATAYADGENEYQIQLALKELTRGKTVVMIAHRLSTVQEADRICVIHEGRIEESGKHAELIGKEGIYTQMWKLYEQATRWKVTQKGGQA